MEKSNLTEMGTHTSEINVAEKSGICKRRKNYGLNFAVMNQDM